MSRRPVVVNDIAVPLEQLGAEMAEELITNIEKWLPDSADRDQWKMEEPLEDLETPMAELPKELEDIVGDLRQPHTGVLFAVPVTAAWGLPKQHFDDAGEAA